MCSTSHRIQESVCACANEKEKTIKNLREKAIRVACAIKKKKMKIPKYY